MEVREYLKELRRTKNDRPEETREALKIYIRMWEGLLKDGVVRRDDGVEEALRKIDSRGGLYKATGG